MYIEQTQTYSKSNNSCNGLECRLKISLNGLENKSFKCTQSISLYIYYNHILVSYNVHVYMVD